jgi:hypothetical protein
VPFGVVKICARGAGFQPAFGHGPATTSAHGAQCRTTFPRQCWATVSRPCPLSVHVPRPCQPSRDDLLPQRRLARPLGPSPRSTSSRRRKEVESNRVQPRSTGLPRAAGLRPGVDAGYASPSQLLDPRLRGFSLSGLEPRRSTSTLWHGLRPCPHSLFSGEDPACFPPPFVGEGPAFLRDFERMSTTATTMSKAVFFETSPPIAVTPERQENTAG